MKLATIRDGSRDGRLAVVSTDMSRAAFPNHVMTLQAALDDWVLAEPVLRALATALDANAVPHAFDFKPEEAAAPFPRAFQWLDASAYLNHGRLMQQAFNLPPNDESQPLMYQGASDNLLGPTDRAVFPAVEDGIDFEAEFAVVVGDVPMGVSAGAALDHIRLLMLVNDWSLRGLARREMAGGFGFLQAKPATAFGPVAVTPDALGDDFRDGRLHLRMRVDLNGTRFGDLDGSLIDFTFGDLIAHAARTRNLRAGTIVGSGTVSNPGRAAGSGCLSERRVIEMIDHGGPSTPYMNPTDRVRIEAFDSAGRSVFGAIDQTVAVSVN